MKTIVLIFFFSLSCLGGIQAQSPPDFLYQKFQKNLHFSFSDQLQLSNLNHQAFSPSFSSSIDNAVHYDGFFCKMELKNRERFHIWIKVHAGQYDTYTHATENFR